jgi:UDP:flavonoid glycosyltransferase YjiC (YdhE family)
LGAAGHDPVIATHEPFRDLVETCGAEFRALHVAIRIRVEDGPAAAVAAVERLVTGRA